MFDVPEAIGRCQDVFINLSGISVALTPLCGVGMGGESDLCLFWSVGIGGDGDDL